MQKDFERWNAKKKLLHETEFTGFVHEREVWWCSLGANVGVEADGKHENFERPVLILKKFNRDAVLIVPLTSRPKPNPYHFPFAHKNQLYGAVVSQVRLVSTKRLLRRVYRMSSSVFDDIVNVTLAAIKH